MKNPLEIITEELLKEMIEKSKEDPDNLCLHHKTHRCSNESCEGYSSAIICPEYTNKKHLESFKQYKI